MKHTEQELPASLQRPHRVTDLATLYGVDYRTVQKWVAPFEEEIGPKHGRYYSVAQVRIIIERLGLPANDASGE